MPETKKTINELSTTSTSVENLNFMVQPNSTANVLEKMSGSVIANKISKVSFATANHFPKLTASGEIVDSGIGTSDIADIKYYLSNFLTQMKTLIQQTVYNTSSSNASATISAIDSAVSAMQVTNYSITSVLSFCTLSNSSTSTGEGTDYTTTVTASTGYSISSVTVTMTGVDITSSVWNSGTSTISIDSVMGPVVITAVAEEHIELPEGYTQLSYVATSGEQWVDTGIQEGNATRAVYEVMVTSVVYNKGNHILSGYHTYFPFLRRTTAGNPEIGLMNRGNETPSSGSKEYSWSLETRYTIEGYSDVKINGTTMCVCGVGGSSDLTQNLILFNFTRSSANDYKFRGRLYSCKIYGSNDTLLRNFIPCKNGSNVAGLYDVVTSTFYYSQTGTALIAGDEV